MDSNKRLVVRAVSFAVAIIIAVFIFSMSAQTRTESASTSGGLIKKIILIINADFEKLTEERQQVIVENLQFIVRKTAHFSLYASLCFFLGVAMMTFEKLKYRWRLISAYFFAVIYAASDETHQLFVPGRGCQLRDVFIDALGAAFGLLIVWLLFLIYKKYALKKKKA